MKKENKIYIKFFIDQNEELKNIELNNNKNIKKVIFKNKNKCIKSIINDIKNTIDSDIDKKISIYECNLINSKLDIESTRNKFFYIQKINNSFFKKFEVISFSKNELKYDSDYDFTCDMYFFKYVELIKEIITYKL